MPLALAACNETPAEEAEEVQEEIIEEEAPPGDSADVIGDGEIIDEPGEPEGGVGADTAAADAPAN